MAICKRIRDYGPWSRAQREHDLEREIQNHLDIEAEELGEFGFVDNYIRALSVDQARALLMSKLAPLARPLPKAQNARSGWSVKAGTCPRCEASNASGIRRRLPSWENGGSQPRS